MKLTKKSKDKNMQVNWRSKRLNQRKHGKQQPRTAYKNVLLKMFSTLEIFNWWSLYYIKDETSFKTNSFTCIFRYSWHLYVSINCRNFRSSKRFHSAVKIFVNHKFRLVLIFVHFNFCYLAKTLPLSIDEIVTNKVYSETLCRWSKAPRASPLLEFHDVGIRQFYERNFFLRDIFCV